MRTLAITLQIVGFIAAIVIEVNSLGLGMFIGALIIIVLGTIVEANAETSRIARLLRG